MSDHTIAFYTESDGTLHIRVDAPGERAVSAPVGASMAFVRTFVSQTDDLDLREGDNPNSVVVSVRESG